MNVESLQLNHVCNGACRTHATVLTARAGVLGLSAHHTAVVVGTLAIAPLLFIPSFKKLSWLSAAGCVSTVLVTATVVAAVAIDPSREGMPVQALARRRLNHAAAVEATGLESQQCLCLSWTAGLLQRRCMSVRSRLCTTLRDLIVRRAEALLIAHALLCVTARRCTPDKLCRLGDPHAPRYV